MFYCSITLLSYKPQKFQEYNNIDENEQVQYKNLYENARLNFENRVR
jgi:hypothetical protein